MLSLIRISKSINRMGMGMGNQKTNDIILILCNLIFKIYKYFIQNYILSLKSQISKISLISLSIFLSTTKYAEKF